MALWQIEWLMVTEEGADRIPAFEFLRTIPTNVSKQLLAILDAVRHTGPDQWMDPDSHAPMHGDLDFVHEIRDRQGQTLYRLFIVWRRDDKLAVLIDGRTKANNTTIPDSEYEKIAELAHSARDGQHRAADAARFARLALEMVAVAKDFELQAEELDAQKAELEALLDEATADDA